MAHIGGDHLRPALARCLVQQFAAARARGQLGAQVGQVAVGIAGRILRVGQHLPHRVLAKRALVDQQEIVDQNALLLDRRALRRHGAGGDPADIGMMATRRDEGVGLARAIVVEHRHDHGDIGQVRAAPEGIVDRIGIAAPQPAPVARLSILARATHFEHARDTVAHASKVHGDVRRIGDQRAGRIEQRAGEIEPFLDVYRGCGVLQHHAHFLGNRHEQVVEDLQPDRIDLRPDRARALQWRGA